MKYAVIALSLFATVYAASDVGQFVPKAFFILDSEGHQSNVHPVNAHLLRRLRRQVFSSSSSSSSSSSGNGVVITSQSHQVQRPDGSIESGGSLQHIQTAPIIGQRFGDDSPTDYSQTATGSGNNPNSYQSYYPTQNPIGSYVSYTHYQDAQGHVQHFEDKGTLNNGVWQRDPTTSTTTPKY